MEVKDDIEKLYVRVPVHLRMDLPLAPQTLHPSASSSGGILSIFIFGAVCFYTFLFFICLAKQLICKGSS